MKKIITPLLFGLLFVVSSVNAGDLSAQSESVNSATTLKKGNTSSEPIYQNKRICGKTKRYNCL